MLFMYNKKAEKSRINVMEKVKNGDGKTIYDFKGANFFSSTQFLWNNLQRCEFLRIDEVEKIK